MWLEVIVVDTGRGHLDVPQADADHVRPVLLDLSCHCSVGVRLFTHQVGVKDLDLVALGQVGRQVAQADGPDELHVEGREGLDQQNAHSCPNCRVCNLT